MKLDCLLLILDFNQILESLGYKITIWTSSLEALELFKAKADSFDLDGIRLEWMCFGIGLNYDL